MQVTCPTCFARYPVEAGMNDQDARRVADAIAAVPAGLGGLVLRYAGLFRSPDRLLDWSRAVNIIERVSRMIAEGEIRRAAARAPATPAIWQEALEQMLGRRDGLDLPLTSDGYIKKVVFEIASKRAEERKDTTARSRPDVSRDGGKTPRRGPAWTPEQKEVNRQGLQRLHDALHGGSREQEDGEA